MAKRRGRPPKISQQKIDEIRALVAGGAYIETAAAFAGIHKETLYEWLRTGAKARDAKKGVRLTKKQRLCREFSDAMLKAVAQAELKDMSIIGTAAEQAWQAAAWRLERRNRNRYGRNVMGQGADAEDVLRSTGVMSAEGSREMPEALVLPVALPADAYTQLTEAMRRSGSLPGSAGDEAVDEDLAAAPPDA